MMRRSASTALLFLLTATSAFAQDPLGWNSPRALELIERARLRRELPRGDSTLQNYQAKANGYVYFYLDRREDSERTLVKVDQIALNLYWKRPNLTKQRIVGLRDVSRLPNRMYYHLDHLTVVQNNLGNVIKIGDGDEVRDVPHPAAPGAEAIYDFRIADSVTLQLGGGQPEVRVYQINVRPRQHDRSAMIGSIFVDRASADIVRMTFTFTPASYVDRRLDYINISLDNGLFGGKYWLPNEQSVEIRRQLPELDFAAGAVIKGRISISSYAFNEAIPDSVFYGRPVSAAPEAERESFPFPADIYAGVVEEGLAPPPQMAELRAQAAALIGQTRLSGLPAWRLYVPNASSVLRHNETEGWFGGAGITYAPATTFRLDVTGGYAFGAEKPAASVAIRFSPDEEDFSARAYLNETRDIGPYPGMPGVLNTFSSGFGGSDYTDLYWTSGARIDVRTPLRFAPRWTVGAFASLEKQRAVLSGLSNEIGLMATRPADGSGGSTWIANISASRVHFKPDQEDLETGSAFRMLARSDIWRVSANQRRDWLGSLGIGSTDSGFAQHQFLIGGRETVPGYPYRAFESDFFLLGRTEYSHTISDPWLRLRLLGYGAITSPTHESTDPDYHGSLGVGVGLLWDALRVDVVKGARWQTVVSLKREFWDML